MRIQFLVAVLLWTCQLPPPAAAQSKSIEAKLIRALKDPSFKVRLQAAIFIGNNKQKNAAPALIDALADSKDSVRAAAALALGQIGAQQAREQLVGLLADQKRLVWRSAEKALIQLDHLQGRPKILLVIEKPNLPRHVKNSHSAHLQKVLSAKLGENSLIQLSAGENTVLADTRLRQHLQARKLTGILIRPKLLKLAAQEVGGQTHFLCKINLMTITLLSNRMEFAGSGETEAEVEIVDIPSWNRIKIEKQLMDAAANAAAEQVLNYLNRRSH